MSNQGISTIALHAGRKADPTTGACALPIYQTASYEFKSTEYASNLFALKEFGNIYSRLTNPTVAALEECLAALDGGTAAVATASGMSAIFLAITNVAAAGDHIVTSCSLYGGTETLFRYTLPRFGIEVTFLEDFSPENITAAIKENTKLVFCETIGNPNGEVPDFTAVSAAAHQAGVPLFVDNTFAPGLCRPIEYGVDIVLYSCTKWIGGHGTTLGGMIVDSGKFDWSNGRFADFTTPDQSYHGVVYWDVFGDMPGAGNIAFAIKVRVQGLRNIGPCLSPYSAFQLCQGVETLPLRMEKHCANALALAKVLEANDAVEQVIFTGLPDHPSHQTAAKYLKGGFGSVFCFELKGGQAAALKFIESVKMARHLANVGDAKTLVIHPHSTTHQQLSEAAKVAAGALPGLIRISVGIEDIEDIIADVTQAIN
ncbi:MAG: O-acetylhomoserine aminocarboxypropyltransferase/cysteine synthase [Victivallaceae bacterium]|nr:O-acetylhomoserine aminocarboxypropyltransferase/cysteine synthase [Victivallaceae bacterium]